MPAFSQETGKDLRREQKPIVRVRVEALQDSPQVAPVEMRIGINRGQTVGHGDAAAFVLARERGRAVYE